LPLLLKTGNRHIFPAGLIEAAGLLIINQHTYRRCREVYRTQACGITDSIMKCHQSENIARAGTSPQAHGELHDGYGTFLPKDDLPHMRGRQRHLEAILRIHDLYELTLADGDLPPIAYVQ
jgi:hypothetical protein